MNQVHASKLSPGFDKAEYIELLKLYSRQGDETYYKDIPASKKYSHTYRSDICGLENRWDLAMSSDSVAVLSIRGTIDDPISLAANFYAVMAPASGSLTLADDFKFDYHLADHPRAAVHLGWLICMAFLSRDILPKIDSCYNAGVRDFIVLGHSQGGAIAYLLTSYINNLQKQKRIPADITIKTYCSAAPKPGNLFYAYEYERMTMGGWSFNVINTADWVPETPVAVQMVQDLNINNPFSNPKSTFSKQKFPMNLALRYVSARLKAPVNKAHRRNQTYLGKITERTIKKHLPGYQAPKYFPSSHFVRTGTTIVLYADSVYYQQYPDDKDNLFIHHMIQPYLYLAEKLPE